MDTLLLKIKATENVSLAKLTHHDLNSKGLTSIKLRDYQLVGVNWLLSRISQNQGAILADEMGLGKTCQSISFLIGLSFQKISGPFLIISPLAVIDNWRTELTKFSPSFKVVVYIGEKTLREDMQAEAKKGNFTVFLTTYEIAMKDEEFLASFRWNVLIVDEAHRLKNKDSILHQMLSDLNIKHRILLTGTPVQNNLTELYALLHFVAPKYFSWKLQDQFLADFEEEKNKDELFRILKPFILRRTKAEAVKDLPSKSEVILFHGITNLQKKYYKALLLKDREAMGPKQSKLSLMNILVQLRKCVNHPYLFDGVEPEPFELGDHLVNASGKLVLIDQLLSYLKPLGHKVLLFSQMTRMLDILQDYATLRGFSYERLDGSVRGEERFLAVKNFQETDDTFIFLLSTKAGGQGLNLTSADTVIFVDSDFNPQNDLQAAARAHRIGQTRSVKIIRLLAQNTVEEIIVRRAHSKLKLTNQVIEGGQFALGVDKETLLAESNMKLQDILKFGIHELFNATNNEDDDRFVDPPDFTSILGASEDGEWRGVSQDIEEEGKTEEEEERGEQHMYMFEGRDYSKEPSAADHSSFTTLIEENAAAFVQLSGSGAGDGGEYTLRRKGTTTAGILTGGLEEVPRKPRAKLSPEELAARKKKRAENLERRRQEEEAEELETLQGRKQKLLQKWHDNNYTSHGIELSDSERGSDESDLDEDLVDLSGAESGEEGADAGEREGRRPTKRIDIRYVSGDVTHPQFASQGNAIIGHCVDYSGNWSTRGLFAAISARSPQPEHVYQLASSLQDLALGDLHVIPCDDVQSRLGGNDFVGLLVAQQRLRKTNTSVLKMLALDLCLRKLCKVARVRKSTVHLPRIGHDDPKCNWYGVERLVRKRLSAKGIPVFVYYYPRRRNRTNQKRARTVTPPPSSPQPTTSLESSRKPQKSRDHDLSDDDDADDSSAPVVVRANKESKKGDPPLKKRLKDISDSDSGDSDYGAASSLAPVDTSIQRSSLHLQNVLHGKVIHLFNVSDTKKLVRLVVAQSIPVMTTSPMCTLDGELSRDITPRVTHLVAGSSAALPDTIPKSCIVVKENWIIDCFSKKECLPEKTYK